MFQRRLYPRVVSRLAKSSKLLRLMFLNGFVDQKDIDRRFIAHDELVQADNDFLFSLDRTLVFIGRIVNLTLRESSLDRGNHAADRVQPVKVLPAALLH